MHRFLTMFLLSGSAFLNPASVSAASQLPILFYHEIRAGDAGPPDSATAISQVGFAAHIQYLHVQGYVTPGMNEVVRFMHERVSPAKKTVAIHFDDEWKPAQNAITVGNRLGFKASFGVTAGTGIGRPHRKWDAIDAIARNPRFDIFSHTTTRPWKDRKTLVDWIGQNPDQSGIGQVDWDLKKSRHVLKQGFGQPVSYLAWPRGLSNDALIDQAKEVGYRTFLTIDERVNRHGGDSSRIHRTLVHGACNTMDLKMIMSDDRYRNCAKSL